MGPCCKRMQVRWVYGVLAVLGVQCASSVLTLHAQARPAAPAAAKGQTHPAPVAKTPSPRRADGQPNLEGVWDYRTLTPLERSREFAEKEFLTEEEVADLERRAEARPDGRTPDDARTTPSVHPPWWLDYGRKVVGTRRSSLIVDPPDGRIPPLTPDAAGRQEALRAAAQQHGPSDNAENRTLWERCVTRGLPEGMLPAAYNNNIKIIQSPGVVVILMEMIHDARIIPLDGRPHLPSNIRRWLGDSRVRWDGETLVVETANFPDKVSFRGASSHLRMVERFTRIDADMLDYRFTLEDPTTWTRPWTVSLPMTRSPEEVYEYACHEGNYGLENILRNARAGEPPPR
jgi:hypothetical protein